MVKVVGCKPIGSPGVGSNPAHLKKEFMFNYKKNFLVLFQTKSFLDVNIFAAKNDHYLRLNLVYSFIYKNSFAFNIKNIPSNCIINNQKNFLNFLNSCVINNNPVTFFSNSNFKNITKALNYLFLFNTSKHEINLKSTSHTIIYLDNKYSNKVNSRFQEILEHALIIKPISSDNKIDFQIYYLLIDLSSDLNKFIYLNMIKTFLLLSKQNLIYNNFKKYFFLKNNFYKYL